VLVFIGGGSVAKERKGKHVDIYVAVVMQNGTRDKCPYFCCKDFFVTFLNCRFVPMSLLTVQFSPFRHCRHWNHYQSQKVMGLLCVELRKCV
jgi:hypothetical protein